MTKPEKDLTSSSKGKKPRVNGAKKGKQFERDVANAIGHIFPEAERQLEYQASSCIGTDIQGAGPFKIQCKNYAAYSSISKIREVIKTDKNDIPVLVTKGIRMEPMAVLPFRDFVTLLEVVYGHTPTWAVNAAQQRIDQAHFSVADEEYPEAIDCQFQSAEGPEAKEVEETKSLNYFI